MTGSAKSLVVNIGVKSGFWRVTSPCGEVREGCWSDIPTSPLDFRLAPIRVHGCTTGKNYFGVFPNTQFFPITVTVQPQNTNGSNLGSPVSHTFNSASEANRALWRFEVPYAQRYTYTATNSCNQQTSGNATPTTPTAIVGWRGSQTCPNPDPVRVSIRFTNESHAPNLTSIPVGNITITNNNTNQVYSAIDVSETNNAGSMNFANIPAGTYTLKVDVPNADGNCDIIVNNLKIDPVNPPITRTLNVGGAATQQCGGSGTIRATASGTITQTTASITFNLTKKGSTTVLASNNTGVFPNLAPGDYTVTATTSYGRCGNEILTATKDFTITPDGAEPQIVKKLGVVCDKGNTGIASLLLAGASPFKILMKKSTEPETAFVLQTDNAGTSYIKEGIGYKDYL